MLRRWIVASAVAPMLCVGCGGSAEPKAEKSNAPAVTIVPPNPVQQLPTKSVQIDEPPPPAVVEQAKKAPDAKSDDLAPPKSVSKKDDAPGLILPDADNDAVGSKGPELPIR